nr:hypothetical protein [Acetobacter syzygii]
MAYREIRVRPVVRYIITEFTCDDDMKNQSSTEWGEFDNAHRANVMANSMRYAEHYMGDNGVAVGPETVVEECRPLRIRWERGPGEPKEAIQWKLEESN